MFTFHPFSIFYFNLLSIVNPNWIVQLFYFTLESISINFAFQCTTYQRATNQIPNHSFVHFPHSLTRHAVNYNIACSPFPPFQFNRLFLCVCFVVIEQTTFGGIPLVFSFFFTAFTLISFFACKAFPTFSHFTVTHL